MNRASPPNGVLQSRPPTSSPGEETDPSLAAESSGGATQAPTSLSEGSIPLSTRSMVIV